MNAYRPVNRIAEYTHEGQELIEEYPVTTVAVVFGIGLATGLVIASLLSESTPEASRSTQTARRLGQQLLDSMHTMLPETVFSTIRRGYF